MIKGKLKFYDQSAAYSSIAVTLTPSEDSKPLTIGGWQPGNTIRTAVESLVQILQGLADILIWFVIVVLPFAIVLYIAYRLSRRIWPGRVSTSIDSPAPETETPQDTPI